MTQVRFFARAPRATATALFDALDERFGEEGAPVSVVEIDEAADVHEVSIYFEDGASADEAGVGEVFGAQSFEREDIPETDWMAKVLADLRPVRAGRFLVHGAHDRGRVRANDLAIEIEAGQAFGTGHHGTTAGCLAMIETVMRRRRPRRVLDLGTGSAVLAIAAAKLGRVPVLATDIDPVAVAVAAENVRANRVHAYVRTAVAAGFHAPAFRGTPRFDLVIANILAGPLMMLAPQMERHLSPGGELVLSGILARQRRAVLAAYQVQGLYHRETLHREEWVTLRLSR